MHHPALGATVRRLAPWLALSAAVLSPLAVHWAAGRTLVWWDTQLLYAPQRWLLEEALRAFRLPLWNPHLGAGLPFLAEPIHGVLHPVSVAVAWLVPGRSADWLIGAHVLAAALGTAWLALELGGSRSAAALAAVTYALSGFVLSMAGNLVFLAGAGSLPFCLAGMRRIGAAGDAAGLAAGALGPAALAFSGDAQALALGGPLGLALAIEAGGLRGGIRAAGAGLLGLLVAAVQLLPAAVHVPRTSRALGAIPGVEHHWALELTRLAELALPGLFVGEVPAADPVYAAVVGPGRWPPGTAPLPFSASIAVGLVPLALATVGLTTGRRGRLLGAVALLLLWIGLGPALGASALLRHVPIWGSFRYAEKLVGPLTLVLALLSSLGADAARGSAAVARRTLGAAVVLGVAAFLAGQGVAASLEPALAQLFQARLERGAWLSGAVASLLIAFAFLHGRLGPRARASLLLAAAWAGAVTATPAALRPGDPAARRGEEVHPLVAAPPGPRVITPYWYQHESWPEGLDGFDEAGIRLAAMEVPALNVLHRRDNLEVATGMVPLRLLRLSMLLGPRWPGPAARRYSATHALLEPPRSLDQAARHQATVAGATPVPPPAPGVEAWALPHRPWAGFARAARTASSEEQALVETLGAIGRGDDTLVVVADAPPGVAPGVVRSILREPERLRLEAEAAGDALLVVSDAWWPGWEATIDGRPVPILLADALVRAVAWPTGRHVLEMRYHPPEVTVGLGLSALGLAALAALLGWTSWSRARGGRSIARGPTPPVPVSASGGTGGTGR